MTTPPPEDDYDFYPGSTTRRKPVSSPQAERAGGSRVEIQLNERPTIKWVNGVPCEFFTIGALASALRRPVITVRHWTVSGILPLARYRNPDKGTRKGRRFYTRPQIQAVVDVFVEHDLYEVDRIYWSGHKDVAAAISKAWDELPPL